MKIHLTESLHKSKRVFIDCDELTNLEFLFDYVGSQTQFMLALMSTELLFRPWCLGELVTAHVRQVRVVQLAFPNFVLPDQQIIAHYESYVDVGILAPYGIDHIMIQDMLHWLRGTSPMVLSASVSDRTLPNPTLNSLDPRTKGERGRGERQSVLCFRDNFWHSSTPRFRI